MGMLSLLRNSHTLSTAETTLELLDSHRKVAGLLIVELRESETVQAGRAAVSAARRDITDRGIAISSAMPDSVDDVLAATTSASAVASPLVVSFKHVLDKTKVIVDFIDKTAKVSVHK